MFEPPTYPRVPRLDAAAGDDLVVDGRDRRGWLTSPVLVEEKLDGANVTIWLEREVPRVAGRAGLGAVDRAGQLGRLRAWAAERLGPLRTLLAEARVLYGEWLWLEHSVSYDVLPDYLIVVDLWTPAAGFAPAGERDARAAAAGLAVPAPLHAGVVGEVAFLERLTRGSAYRDGPAEGAVLRRDHPDGRFDRCKWVRPDFDRRTDQAWTGRRRHNRLAPTAAG